MPSSEESQRPSIEERAQEAVKSAMSNLLSTMDLYDIDHTALVIGLRFGNEESGGNGVLFEGHDDDVVALLEHGIEQVRRTAGDRDVEGGVEIKRTRSRSFEA